MPKDLFAERQRLESQVTEGTLDLVAWENLIEDFKRVDRIHAAEVLQRRFDYYCQMFQIGESSDISRHGENEC